MTATYTTSAASGSGLGEFSQGLPLAVFKQVTDLAGLVHGQVSFGNRATVFAVGVLDTRTAHPSPAPIRAWQQQPIIDADRAVVVVIRDRTDSPLPKVDLETVALTLTGVTRHKHLTATDEFAGTADPAFRAVFEHLGIPVFGPLPLRSPNRHP